MGCDIHMFVEYKCGNGMPWQADEHHFPVWESRCKDDEDVPEAEWCDHCRDDGDNQKYCDAGYLDYSQVRATGRDYTLFGLLASVRGDGPREALGLPENVSELVAAAAERAGGDGHSHSYMSLEEFKRVCLEERDLEPTTFDDAFYDLEYPGGYKDQPPDYTTLINYCEKLKDKNSIDKHILGPDTSTEVQIRLVFWFDN